MVGAGAYMTTKPNRPNSASFTQPDYIAQLYAASNWSQLWLELDSGDYGRLKLARDPLALDYAQDLTLGQQAATRPDLNFEEALDLLPNLWRYTLLKHSLLNVADRYPAAFFETLIELGQAQTAITLVERLTVAEYKVDLLCAIVPRLQKCSPTQAAEVRRLLHLAAETAPLITSNYERTHALLKVATLLYQFGETATIPALLATAAEIDQNDPTDYRNSLLCEVALTMLLLGEKEVGHKLLDINLALAIYHISKQVRQLSAVGEGALVLQAVAAATNELETAPYQEIAVNAATSTRSIVVTLVGLGGASEVEQAIKLLARTHGLVNTAVAKGNVSSLNLAYSYLAEAYAALGNWAEVRKLLALIDPPWERLDTYVVVLAQMLRPDQAEASPNQLLAIFLAEATELALLLMIDYSQYADEDNAKLLLRLIKLLLQSGDITQAIKITQNLVPIDARTVALSWVALHIVEKHDYASASQWLGQVEKQVVFQDSYRVMAVALSAHIAALVKANSWLQAVTIAVSNGKTENADLAGALAGLVKALTQASLWDEALAVVALLPDYDVLKEVALELVTALLKAEQPAKAELLLQISVDTHAYPVVLALLAKHTNSPTSPYWQQLEQWFTTHVPQTLTIANEQSAYAHAQHLCLVVEVLVHAGEIPRVEQLLTLSADKSFRGTVFHALLEVLITTGDLLKVESLYYPELTVNPDLESKRPLQEILKALAIAWAERGEWDSATNGASLNSSFTLETYRHRAR